MKKDISILYIIATYLVIIASATSCFIAKNSKFYAFYIIVVLLLLFLSNIENIFKIRKIYLYEFFWILTILPVFFNNYSLKKGDFGEAIRFLTIIFFLLTVRGNKKILIHYNLYMKLGYIYAFFTWLFFVSPSLYKKYIYKAFPSITASRVNPGSGLTNHYSLNAMFLSITLGILFSHIIAKKDKIKVQDYFKLLFVVGALFLTGKKGPPLFCLIAIFITYYFSQKGKHGRLLKTMGIVLIVVLFIYVIYQINPSLIPGLSRIFDNSENISLSGRDKLYSAAIKYFNEEKLFGIGWGKFKYFASELGLGTGEEKLNVHNIYLNLLCEVGLIGTIIFIVAFISSLYSTIGIFTKLKKKVDIEIENLYFSIFMQFFFLLCGISGNSLYDMPTLFMYIYSIAITSCYRQLYLKNNNKE